MIDFVNNKAFSTCPHCGKATDKYGYATMSLQPLVRVSDKKILYFLFCLQCKWHTLLRETTDELLQDLISYREIGVYGKRLEEQAEKGLSEMFREGFPFHPSQPEMLDVEKKWVKIAESNGNGEHNDAERS